MMERPPSEQVVHRALDVDGAEPAMQIAEHVAALSDRDVESLASTWETFGHVVDDLFEDPPAPSAQVQVTFTYEGYRITVDQEGYATFVAVDGP